MKYILAGSLFFLVACKSTQPVSSGNNINTLPANISINGKMFSSLFQQQAAEYRALCFQGYNLAQWRIATYQPASTKPKAIITDIDETILDNSPYAVHNALAGKDYDANSWFDWTDRSAADTMPGAGNLLRFAASKGVEIFYITNREERERKSTLANLQKFGLPNADDAHFLPKQNTSSKEARRLQVMNTHEVILLMGDNLTDFSALYDKRTVAERRQQTDAFMNEFGKKFIMFPNANYGDWETSLGKYKYNWTVAQKDSIVKANLRSY